MRHTTLIGSPGLTAVGLPDLRFGAVAVPGALEVVRALASRLDTAGLRYCQFKSNCHLEEGLQGLTDLDVLVEPHAGSHLGTVLAQSGYRRFSPPPGGDYPGVEDFLALDAATGRLVHLHLHHRLTTGEPHLKGHHLPWEELMLATRRRDARSGFFIADPSVELLFFLTRNTLKLGLPQRIRALGGRDPVRDGLGPEFEWLRERSQAARVLELGRSLLPAPAEPVLREILEAGPSLRRMLALRRRVMPALRRYRTHEPLAGWLGRRRREFQSLHAKLGRRFPALAGATSRTDPRGGVLVAFMGPDGAGKSRLANQLASWLRWKLDARVTYFGSGDGPSSLVRWPLRLALRAAKALGIWTPGRRTAEGAPGGAAAGVNPAGLREPGFARAVWALVLAFEKRQKLRLASRTCDRGIVVLCDRFPQAQVLGFNDGPLLERWSRSRSGFKRALAAWEARPYRWSDAHPPKLVFKLRVSPEVAVIRKPDMQPAEIRRRLAALASLRYPAGTRVVEVDADRAWEAVLLDCKRALWEML